MTNKIFDSDFLRKIERLKLFVKRILPTVAEGNKVSKRVGSGIDFMNYRGYVQGDEIRYVDWNVYARSEGLFIREFAKEDAVPIYIILDNSPSMDFGAPSKFIFAKKLSAALAYIGLVCLDKITICLGSNDGFVSQGFRGEYSASQVFDMLYSLEINRSIRLEEIVVRTRSIAKKGGAFFIISDFWDSEMQKDVKELTFNNSEVSLVHILSNEEVKPSTKGKIRLFDSEGSTHIDRFVGEEELIEYDRLLKGHIDNYKQFAMRYNMNYIFAPTDSAFEEVIMVYLREAFILR